MKKIRSNFFALLLAFILFFTGLFSFARFQKAKADDDIEIEIFAQNVINNILNNIDFDGDQALCFVLDISEASYGFQSLFVEVVTDMLSITESELVNHSIYFYFEISEFNYVRYDTGLVYSGILNIEDLSDTNTALDVNSTIWIGLSGWSVSAGLYDMFMSITQASFGFPVYVYPSPDMPVSGGLLRALVGAGLTPMRIER